MDVARLAGVSRATVSHVLNGQTEKFNADTVERVRSAAAELGYVRSTAGRALAMGRSDLVVVVVPYTTFIRLQDVIEVLSSDIAELGFSMVVHFSMSRTKEETPNRLLHLIETLRPAGVVDLGGVSRRELDLIEKTGCAVLPRKLHFDVNHWIGILQARHLHSRGYTELVYAFLSDVRDDPYGRSRSAAVTEFCEAEGLTAPIHVHVPIEPEGAEEALKTVLEQRGRPVGIACFNDEVAVAVVFAAKRLGLSVPGDVAVIGAEGAEIGQAVSPRVTTVKGDVPAAVRHIRYLLAQTFGGPAPSDGIPPQEDAYSILPGETT
nr:LacI family DNA-binding transcriptional regulator [Actinomadura rugatobispora]